MLVLTGFFVTCCLHSSPDSITTTHSRIWKLPLYPGKGSDHRLKTLSRSSSPSRWLLPTAFWSRSQWAAYPSFMYSSRRNSPSPPPSALPVVPAPASLFSRPPLPTLPASSPPAYAPGFLLPSVAQPEPMARSPAPDRDISWPRPRRRAPSQPTPGPSGQGLLTFSLPEVITIVGFQQLLMTGMMIRCWPEKRWQKSSWKLPKRAFFLLGIDLICWGHALVSQQ